MSFKNRDVYCGLSHKIFQPPSNGTAGYWNVLTYKGWKRPRSRINRYFYTKEKPLFSLHMPSVSPLNKPWVLCETWEEEICYRPRWPALLGQINWPGLMRAHHLIGMPTFGCSFERSAECDYLVKTRSIAVFKINVFNFSLGPSFLMCRIIIPPWSWMKNSFQKVYNSRITSHTDSIHILMSEGYCCTICIKGLTLVALWEQACWKVYNTLCWSRKGISTPLLISARLLS